MCRVPLQSHGVEAEEQHQDEEGRYESCTTCHRPRTAGADVAFHYEDVRPWARAIRDKAMPWGKAQNSVSPRLIRGASSTSAMVLESTEPKVSDEPAVVSRANLIERHGRIDTQSGFTGTHGNAGWCEARCGRYGGDDGGEIILTDIPTELRVPLTDRGRACG